MSCKENFTQQEALTNHIVEKHVTDTNNVCDICGKALAHKTSVVYHKEVSIYLFPCERNVSFLLTTGGAQQYGPQMRRVWQRIPAQATASATRSGPLG